ncbi:MAG: hypothetical protein N0C90_08915, partial [Candidatus Thiodiazotropha endolucinida]|nr:hypothetical protein [Candidatus Thiodiazotropha taylori]MCW4261476.1 hypothetical protein [Candidatus Thiodiazotropha endolucinida]
MLHERMITPLGGKIAPALRVAPRRKCPWGAPEKAPLGVARRSFGITKPLSSRPEGSALGVRLDWRFFRRNRANWI